jgi:signal transduction histidine kinase
MKPLEVMCLIEHSVEANRAYADGFGVKLEITRRVVRGSVLADVDRLEQVMANLLSNAAKFSPRGEPVDVSVEQIDESLRISVTDRGPGIPESFVPASSKSSLKPTPATPAKKAGRGSGSASRKPSSTEWAAELTIERG